MDVGEKSLLEKTTIESFFSNINKDRKKRKNVNIRKEIKETRDEHNM